MLKSIIGVGMTTCNEMLSIELGMLSIRTLIMLKQWVFWKKVHELEGDEPLTHAINEAKRFNLKEVKYYENLVNCYTSKEEIVSKYFEDVKSRIHSKATSGRSKYLTYLLINPDLKTPQIYKQVYDKKDVSMMAKLRTSSHNLQIEMGRRTHTPADQRLCHCGENVENEEHFLLRCESYEEIRRKHNINNIKISELLDNETYIQYIHELWEKRKYIMSRENN